MYPFCLQGNKIEIFRYKLNYSGEEQVFYTTNLETAENEKAEMNTKWMENGSYRNELYKYCKCVNEFLTVIVANFNASFETISKIV